MATGSGGHLRRRLVAVKRITTNVIKVFIWRPAVRGPRVMYQHQRGQWTSGQRGQCACSAEGWVWVFEGVGDEGVGLFRNGVTHFLRIFCQDPCH